MPTSARSNERAKHGLRVCMFVYNNCKTDVRVLKEAATLTAAGHDVRVLAVLDRTSEPTERREGFTIIRINRKPVHLRLLRSLRRIRRLPAVVRHRVWRGLRRARRLAWRLLAAAAHRMRLLHAGRGATAPLPAASRPSGPTLSASSADAAPPRPRRAALLHRLRRLVMRAHKPLTYLDYYYRAYRVARAQAVDICHAHDLNTLPVAVAVSRATGARLVYDAHELYPDISTLSPRERRIWRRIEQRLIRRADHVLTVCESIADEFVRRNAIDRPTVLLNCPPRMSGVPLPASSMLRQKAGLERSDEPIILYHGGFIPHRGLEALVAATAHLESGVVVLMGWGKLEAELRELIAARSLQGRVVLIGPVPHRELLAYTSGADIGAIPYLGTGLNNYYTTPNKLFDFIAVGVPVVASRLPELVRFVDGLKIGRTFDPTDPLDIAATIDSVLGDAPRYRSMRARAFAAAQTYNWEAESAKLTRLYRSMGESSAPQPNAVKQAA